MPHPFSSEQPIRALLCLSLLGMAGAAQATCIPQPLNNFSCSTSTHQLITELPRLTMSGGAVQNSAGTWDYTYTIKRDVTQTLSPYRLVSWSLPVGMDAEVSNLSARLDAGYFMSSAAQTDAGIVVQVGPAYAFSTPPLPTPELVSRLTFTSPYAPSSPFEASLNVQAQTQGYSYFISGGTAQVILDGVPITEPWVRAVPIPSSPMSLAGVPEAGTSALMALGLVAVAVGSRRLQSRKG